MIRNWLREGHTHVMKITHQRALSTAQHYDPGATTSKRLTMGSTMWGAQKEVKEMFNCRYCEEKMESIDEIDRHEVLAHGQL